MSEQARYLIIRAQKLILEIVGYFGHRLLLYKSVLVSCIVPVFNGERFLREALDSILAQTHHHLDIIVVDDGSTDGTAAIVSSYGSKFHYLYQHNAGPAAARNLGLTIAKGEYIAFLDADDLWHPEKLARQLKRFQTRPELELSVTLVQNFWNAELRHEEGSYRGRPIAQPLPGYFLLQTLLARRSVFEKVGQLNEALRLGEDVEWFIRVTDEGITVDLTPDVLVYRRLHQNNTSRPIEANREALLHLVKEALDLRRHSGRAVPPKTGSKSPRTP